MIDQPVSVLTNAAYVAAGIFVLRGRPGGAWIQQWDDALGKGGVWDTQGHTRSIGSWLVGIAFIGLGLASAAYHTLHSPAAQLADEVGMYVLFAVLSTTLWSGPIAHACYPGPQERQQDAKRCILAVHLIGATAGLVLAVLAPWLDSFIVIPALVLAMIAAINVDKGLKRALMFVGAFMAIEFIRELPEANFWASEPLFAPAYDLIHGGWHLLTAVFLALAWLSPDIPNED